MAVSAACAATPSDEPSTVWRSTPDDYQAAIIAAVDRHGCRDIDRDLVAAQIDISSGFDATAVSVTGARGPAQLRQTDMDRFGPLVGATDPHKVDDAAAVLVALDCQIAKELADANTAATTRNITIAWVAGVSAATADHFGTSDRDGQLSDVVSRVTALVAP